MPHKAYTEREVEAILRVAYVTGVRDALILLQGHTLSEEQVQQLTPFVMGRMHLRETEKAILDTAGAVAWKEVEWMRRWEHQSKSHAGGRDA